MYKFLVILFIFLGTHLAHAATDDVIISSSITGPADIIPPSIPGSFTATPVATSQIDLSWAASTDNILVSGYQVFRDATQIATTTSLTYSDTALSASTTYAYYVTAFDSSGNISASSTVVSTTTLVAVVATTTPGTSSEGTRLQRIVLERLEIIPGTTSVIIRYVTKGNVRPVVRWGQTSSYELGSIVADTFAKVHETVIDGLLPDQVYTFQIEAENARGRVGLLTDDNFITLPLEDTVPPANVSGATVRIEGDDLVLSWSNPSDLDFEKVRILRSNLFYPLDSADGWFVYEGDETLIRDVGAALVEGRQYYTIFSYDTLGNISSGAVVTIAVGGDAQEIIISAPTPTSTVATSSIPIVFSFDDIIFHQDGKQVEHAIPLVVDGSTDLTISLPYMLMPAHLKAIVVDVFGAAGENLGSYLLRADDSFTYYTATIDAFSKSGPYSLTVSVFDFETYQIGSVSGDVFSKIAHFTKESKELTFFEHLEALFATLVREILFWGLVLMFLFLFLLWRRRSKDT